MLVFIIEGKWRVLANLFLLILVIGGYFLIYLFEEWILIRLLILVMALAVPSTYVLFLGRRGILKFAESGIFVNSKAIGESASVFRSLTIWGVLITVPATIIIVILWSSAVYQMSDLSLLVIWTYACFSVADATILNIKSMEI